MSGPYSGLIANNPIGSLYSCFFGAVSSFQEINGTGNIMIRKNGDGKTIHLDAHYCNYEDRDCSNRIGAYLSFPGMFVTGCGDSFSFVLEKVECSDCDFGLPGIMAELRRSLPYAHITGQTNRDDFCSVQFQT